MADWLQIVYCTSMLTHVVYMYVCMYECDVCMLVHCMHGIPIWLMDIVHRTMLVSGPMTLALDSCYYSWPIHFPGDLPSCINYKLVYSITWLGQVSSSMKG